MFMHEYTVVKSVRISLLFHTESLLIIFELAFYFSRTCHYLVRRTANGFVAFSQVCISWFSALPFPIMSILCKMFNVVGFNMVITSVLVLVCVSG